MTMTIQKLSMCVVVVAVLLTACIPLLTTLARLELLSNVSPTLFPFFMPFNLSVQKFFKALQTHLWL